MDLTCSGMSDLRNLKGRPTPRALCHDPRCVAGHRGVCFVFLTAFGWVVHVKWRPNENQNQRFLSRTLHCNKMINVIHFPCQRF